MAPLGRVLLLLENNPYPFDFRVRREAETLRDAGYSVRVVAPRSLGQHWHEDVDGVTVHRFPAPPSGSGVLGYALEFGYATLAILILTAWIWLRYGIDVIHAGNPPDTLCAVAAFFKPFGVRFVFDQHDLAPETYLSRFAQSRDNLVSSMLRLLERCSYALADIVIVTNESYRELALSRGQRAPESVFVVRNGPPLSYAPVETDPAITCRAAYLVGYVGTIGPQDGLDYWMQAIAELVHTLNRRDFIAIVIGDGDALARVKQLASDLRVDSHVWFTGRLPEDEVRRYLSAVHVCVQPDPLSPLNDRSTMNKLMEYMALGKPTVAFDLRETRHSAQGAATYVQPNDVSEFARRVSQLFDDPSERHRLGQIGRQRVQDGLAWEYSAESLLRAYATPVLAVRGQESAWRRH